MPLIGKGLVPAARESPKVLLNRWFGPNQALLSDRSPLRHLGGRRAFGYPIKGAERRQNAFTAFRQTLRFP